MSDNLKSTKPTAPPTLPNGKPDMENIRLGLAMVMDGLRVMAKAGAVVTVPHALTDGRILMPLVTVHDHKITVMDKRTFAIDGVSVMEAGHGH